MKVVVYGTLKSGYGNNRLLAGCGKIDDCIVRGYKLYNSGFPVATRSDGDCIVGEVWDIEDKKDVLQRLDWLEGHYGNDDKDSMYYRHEVEAHLNNGEQITGFMYVGNSTRWKNFEGMKECNIDQDLGAYRWERY